MTEFSTENPWIINGSEIKMDTPWVRVKLYDVINPSGQPGIYGVTEFKNLAIGIIPIDTEGNTWLVGQYRFPINAYSWEIPEGGGPLHIPPLESAQRELREETGITAKKWTLLQTLHTSNSATNEVAYIYLAEELSFGESEPEPDELLCVEKVPFDEVFRRVMNNEITDSLTVAGILKVKLLQLEGFLK